MANTTSLKRRIGSVKNTKQITKAMELVAASKMRKSTELAHKSRAYREGAYSMLLKLNSITEVGSHPLYQVRTVKKRLYIVITSDKGLAGAYNTNILKALTSRLEADKKTGIKSSCIVVGKKGAGFLSRLSDLTLDGVYTDIVDAPTADDIRPLLTSVIEKYTFCHIDEAIILYTKHVSNITQTPEVVTLLPAKLSEEDVKAGGSSSVLGLNMTFEPSVSEVLDGVTERLLEVQIWQCMLESIASEHSMRMLSMKNATDNANEIIDDLTLEYNTARQGKITQELAEITGGAEALK